MAKIAVVFLLVALVAVCNGLRVPRDAPAAPTNVIPELQPFVDQAKDFFSEKNLDKLKLQGEEIQKGADALGVKANAVLLQWVKSLEDILEKNQAKTTK